MVEPTVALNSGIRLYLRPLIIAAMVSTIAAAWVLVIQSVSPGWQGGYLVAITALVTIETLVVAKSLRLQRLTYVAPRTLEVRLAELGLIVVLLKAAGYMAHGWEQLGSDVERWVRAPESFLDPGLVLGLVVVGGAWWFANSLAANIDEVEDLDGWARDREEAGAGIKTQFLGGAIAILVAAGAQRVIVSPAGIALRPVQPSPATLLPIIYVALGIVLLGQLRFSVLLSRWAQQQVPVAPGMERRWARWALVFVAAICLVSLFLPAGNTSLGIALFVTIAAVAMFLGQVLAFVLLVLLSLVLAPCLFFFRSSESQAVQPSSGLPEFVPPQQTAAPEWLFLVQVLFFAVIAGAVLVFIVRTYWQDRRFAGIWNALWQTLLGWWNAVAAWLAPTATSLQHLLGRKPAETRLKPGPGDKGFWERWRAHTARERVRRLYLALVERAATAGHPRRSAQTPYEFSSDLARHVAGDEEALAALTEAFVAARYSRQDFRNEQVSALHRLWQRLLAKLRKTQG